MHMPTPDEFEMMKESLKFKTDELKKSEVTAQNLISERAKIYDNLQVLTPLLNMTFGCGRDYGLCNSFLFLKVHEEVL